jgi:hexosaminidase
MRTKRPAGKLVIILLLLIVLAFASFRIYRKIRTTRIIEQTLNGKHWTERMNEFSAQPCTSDEIIFIGNSLTEGFDLSVFGNPRVINRGISGDFTQGVLKRLPEITARRPSKIFLMIGINDIIEKVPLDNICSNYEKIIVQILKEAPSTRLHIQSALPVNFSISEDGTDRKFHETFLTSSKEINGIIIEYNKRLRQLSEKYHLVFIDLHSDYLQGGELRSELTYDGLHLSDKGYALWQQRLEGFVNQ